MWSNIGIPTSWKTTDSLTSKQTWPPQRREVRLSQKLKLMWQCIIVLLRNCTPNLLLMLLVRLSKLYVQCLWFLKNARMFSDFNAADFFLPLRFSNGPKLCFALYRCGCTSHSNYFHSQSLWGLLFVSIMTVLLLWTQSSLDAFQSSPLNGTVTGQL